MKAVKHGKEIRVPSPACRAVALMKAHPPVWYRATDLGIA